MKEIEREEILKHVDISNYCDSLIEHTEVIQRLLKLQRRFRFRITSQSLSRHLHYQRQLIDSMERELTLLNNRYTDGAGTNYQ